MVTVPVCEKDETKYTRDHKIYIGTISAMKRTHIDVVNNFVSTCVAFMARSNEEAIGHAFNMAKERWLTSQGYFDHDLTIMELPDSMVVLRMNLIEKET